MKIQLTRNLGSDLAKAADIEPHKALEGSVHEVTDKAAALLGGNAVPVVEPSKPAKAGS